MVEPETAPFAADMRRQEAGSAAERQEFAPQFGARSMCRLPRIVLEGKDPLAHETPRPLGEFGDPFG